MAGRPKKNGRVHADAEERDGSCYRPDTPLRNTAFARRALAGLFFIAAPCGAGRRWADGII
jgi:hypothetical protein